MSQRAGWSRVFSMSTGLLHAAGVAVGAIGGDHPETLVVVGDQRGAAGAVIAGVSRLRLVDTTA